MRLLAMVSGAAAGALLLALFVVLLGQIVLRPFGVLFPWVEEFATFAFIVLVFFSVALAHATDEQLNVGFGLEAARRSRALYRLLRRVNGLAELVFLMIFLVGLVLMARQSWSMFAGSLSGFRLGWVYALAGFAVALSAGIVAVRLARAPARPDEERLAP